MRLTKGNKVEVFSTKEILSGSWYPAEIIHGNGRNYTVKYDGEIGSRGEGIFDRVPRKAIRPCPPAMLVLRDWASGDVVEVLHCLCWKMATILMVLGKDRLSVRLLGSSHELEVRKVDVRPRICWQDDEWKMIGQGSSNHEERQDVPSKLKRNHNSRYTETAPNICLKKCYFPFSNINSVQEIHTNSSRCLKRKLENCHSQSIAYTLQSQKVRVIEKGVKQKQFTSLRQPPLPEKVDAVASSPALLVDKCMPPFNNRLTGCSKSNLGRQKVDGAMGCSHILSLESRGADSITSSVASCSTSRINISKVPENDHRGSFEDNEYDSDAESFCRVGSEEGNYILPADEKLTQEIHRTELHAYRSIIEALYASGPLSWEQETLLTNLRGSLHITNDEHLMELRTLVSTSTCIPSRAKVGGIYILHPNVLR